MTALELAADLEPPDVLVNSGALAHIPAEAATGNPLAVHRRLPGYAPTPLTSYPDLARQVGVGELWVKDESWRLGLPSFKILGAAYATYRALAGRLGREPSWDSVAELSAALRPLGRIGLCAATDGNHGRAVARTARWLGLPADIYVPAGTAQPRIDAIAAEGATVTVVDGGYDDAVRRSAEEESDRCIVVSDTSWPGYTQIPGWVIEGYSTVFSEISDQLAAASAAGGASAASAVGRAGGAGPDVVAIPVGVGALAAATVRHFKAGPGPGTPKLLGVEPESARCVTESLRAGRLVTLPFPQTSIMAGLNCGTPSQLAWPTVSRGLDALVAVSDSWAMAAMRALAAAGVLAGETGAAALAGLHAVCTDPAGATARSALGLRSDSRVLVLCTEGATDPAAWARIVGRPVPPHGASGDPPTAAVR
jgi:diaminopropionate ammonia-lyase